MKIEIKNNGDDESVGCAGCGCFAFMLLLIAISAAGGLGYFFKVILTNAR
jgi:hypothetical protein